jgi:formyl-CoA transferase
MAGPYCSMALGDMGAEVIKIETPGRGDDTRAWGPPFVGGESYYFLSVNRNKRSLTLNLKHEGGKDILRRLAARSDVLLENFRPGAMERLGLGYEDLAVVNPRLVYCSISGYGNSGPQRERPGYDYVLQAEAGHMSLTGHEGGAPVRIGIPLIDLGAAQWATTAILAALLERERTGKGQRVDTSLMEAAVSYLSYLSGLYFATGESPGKAGSAHLSLVPYQAFAGGDGRPFVICAGNDDLWRRLCETLGVAELGTDPRFARNSARVANRAELVALLQRCLDTAPAAAWVARLEVAGVPAGLIRPLAEVFEDEQVRARGMVWTCEHPTAGLVRSVGLPVRFSSTGTCPPCGPGPASGRSPTPPPRLGEHTDEVLGELGYSAAEIRELRAAAVV